MSGEGRDFWRVCQRCKGKANLSSAVLLSLSPHPHQRYFYEPASGQSWKTLGLQYFLWKTQFCPQSWCSLRPRCRAADAPVAVGWFSSGVTFEGSLPVVPTHPVLLALQCGLSCANWIALPESKRAEECTLRAPAASGGVQSTSPRYSWSETPEITAIQTQRWPHHVFHSTVCFFARHYLSVSAKPLPPSFTLLPSQTQADCGGAEPPSPCSALALAPFTGLLCTSTVPNRLVGDGMMGDSPLLIASGGPVSSLVKALLSHFHAEWITAVFKTTLLPFSNPELNLAFLMLLF